MMNSRREKNQDRKSAEWTWLLPIKRNWKWRSKKAIEMPMLYNQGRKKIIIMSNLQKKEIADETESTKDNINAVDEENCAQLE